MRGAPPTGATAAMGGACPAGFPGAGSARGVAGRNIRSAFALRAASARSARARLMKLLPQPLGALPERLD